MTDLPADWALKAAVIAAGPDDYEYDPEDLRIVKNPPSNLLPWRLSKSIIAHARLIEQTQQAPVDRKMLVAREAAAQCAEERGPQYTCFAAQFRAGDADEMRVIDVTTRGIELWESGYAA